MPTNRGITYPIKIVNGTLALSEDADLLREAIFSVLETRPLERVMRPRYGTPNWVFEAIPNATIVAENVRIQLETQIKGPTFYLQGTIDEDGAYNLIINWAIRDIPQPPPRVQVETVVQTPLVAPNLDPRNERTLVTYGAQRVFEVSAGAINDFSSSSIVMALIEALAFCYAEILYYVNQITESITIQFLAIAGVQRRLGTKSVVELTFTLTIALQTPFTIPAGYRVSSATGDQIFLTDEVLVIAPGAGVGTVSASAQSVGGAGNVPAYTLNRLSQPLAYLKSVINAQPATGGTDDETQDQAKARGFASLRRRGLVSQNDYEQECLDFLGTGAIARAIGNLSLDKINEQAGAVHCFVLNAGGQQPNATQLSNLQALLESKSHISTRVFVSSILIQPVDIDVIAAILPGQDPQAVANLAWAKIQQYLNPGRYPVGESVLVKEVEYQIRLVPGVDRIQTVTLNQLATNVAMPHPYAVASPRGFVVHTQTDLGVFDYYFGEGDPD